MGCMDEIPPSVPGYRLTRLLGTGSTSSVWRARREHDDELVAVKLLTAEADDEAVREFAMLQHAGGEHVITLHETLEVDLDEGPGLALVLEYLAGGSLARVVAERGHLTPGETVTVIAPVAQAVAGLHDLGIVHGDLSPGNVLLDSTGRPVLADLGYSRLTGEVRADVYGTEGYVAPEVLEGGEPLRASDVHALGALAWFCLVGAAPGHIAERLDLRDHLPDEPVLADLIEDCLSPDPAKRPEADEVARAVFDAAPAQALRMTSPGDVASSLTRRIREAAAEGGVGMPEWQQELATPRVAEVRRRWWQRRDDEPKGESLPVSRGGRHAAPRRTVDEPIDLTRDASDQTRDASEPRAIARSAAAGTRPVRRAGAVVTVVLALVLAVLVPWQQLASAGGGSQGAGTPKEPTPGSTRGSTHSADRPASVRTERSALRQSSTKLAQELTSLRQEMVVDLDTTVLEELDEPGSAAAKRDTQLVAQLRESGHRYRGLTMTVRSAQVQRTNGSTAVLRMIVDESAYTVVSPQGDRQQRPARRGQEVDLVLTWDARAWQVRDVKLAQ